MKLPFQIKIFENKKLVEETTFDKIWACGEWVLGIRTNNKTLSDEGSYRIWAWEDKKYFWPLYRYNEEYFKGTTEVDFIGLINKKFMEIPTLRKFYCYASRIRKPGLFNKINI